MAEPSESAILDHAIGAEGLRPHGDIWTQNPNSVSRQLFMALGTELARVTGRGVDMIREADPRTTVELLADWERILNVPGPCDNLEPTVLLRQFAITAKLTQKRGTSRQHFIDLASDLGFEISIEEYLPFEAGVGTVGQQLTGADWVFAWKVHKPVESGQFFSAGVGQAGEALLELSQGTLECYLGQAKPAHTYVFFEADLPWSGYAPWTEIRPDPAVLSFTNPTAIVHID